MIEFSWRNWKPTFTVDLDSFYKSIWLGWFLIVWCVPHGNKWWQVEDFSISLMPD